LIYSATFVRNISHSLSVFRNTQVPTVIKIRPVTTKLLCADEQADRQTDRYDEANRRFSEFCELS